MPEPEKQEQPRVGLADFLRIVRERAWVIVLCLLVVFGAALALSYKSTPMYRASSKLLYQTNALDKTLFGSQVFSDTNQPRSVDTAALLVKLPQVAQAVQKQLGSHRSEGELLGMINVVSSTTTNLIQVDAVSPDPDEAANVANAFAQQFIVLRQTTDRATVAAARELVKERLDSLTPTDAASDYGLMLKDKYESLRILESMQNGGFSQVAVAIPPSGPYSPQPLRNGIIAAVMGLVLGVGLAFLLNSLDKRIKDTKTLEQVSGVPVLATVPVVKGGWRSREGEQRSSSPIGFVSEPTMLESFRTLRSSLQYFDIEKGIKTIVITSGLPREGKTVTTVNLGLSMALAGHRVVIVEADLRRPMIPEYLGVDNEVGLSTVLATGVDVYLALRPVNVENLIPEYVSEKADNNGFSLKKSLFCLPSGPLPPNPAELLSSEPMEKLLRNLSTSGSFDYVLIDTPPILSVADALVLAPKVDAVVVTARMGWTAKSETQEVSRQLERASARLIGVVASGAKASRNGYYGHGYYQCGYR